jgi:hypothetical protein
MAGRLIESALRARRERLEVYLCGAHRSERFWQYVIWWTICFAGVMSLSGAFLVREPLLGLLGVSLLLLPLVFPNLYPWLLKAKLIDDRRTIVDGAGEAFLRSLPQATLVPPARRVNDEEGS